MAEDKQPPTIITEFGATTEWCRRQAAENMKEDPVKKAQVIAMIGEAETRRRYPEAFVDEV